MNFRILLILFFFGTLVHGQISESKKKTIPYSNEEVVLDTLSIYPGSVRCFYKNDTLSEKNFIVDYVNKSIRFNTFFIDSIVVEYLSFNVDLSPSLQRFDSSLLFSYDSPDKWKIIEPPLQNINDVFGGTDLSKKGSLSRGVTFGNHQNLGINSTLNLELNGKLSENLNLLASVSDANIPIQPDGTTNKLQDFDQVFIQLYNSKFKMIAGDFWINRPMGYFMNYKKRGQGLTLSYETHTNNNYLIGLQSSTAFSKGKFNRQIIQGIENNQGPYRLKGAENEPFIVILSGTERVYLDGRLLVRGQEFDYVIDYNTSELVFSSKNLITKDARIVVEFQYSDQNFARFLLQQHVSIAKKNTKIWVNYFQEQDLKNQPLQQSLDFKSKSLLHSIGDSIQNAFISGVDSVGFFENQNLYALRDSLGYDSILVFSVHPDSALFRAYFQLVGANSGDYILDTYTAFGKTYKWVAPILGQSQGDYSPVQLMITPKKRALLAAGISYKIKDNWVFESEFGSSLHNINTFSSKDKKNDIGWSNRSKISNFSKIGKNGWGINSTGETEFLDANFSYIEPYRNVEFDRDWNTRNMHLTGSQFFSLAGTQIQKKEIGFIKMNAQKYIIGNVFSGTRLFTEGNLSFKKFGAKWDGSLLSTNKLNPALFIRHRADINFSILKIKIGFKDDHEQNSYLDSSSTLLGKSYSFYDYQFYLQSKDSSNTTFKLFYRDRYDWKPKFNSYTMAAKGTTIGGEVQIKKWKGQNLSVVVGHRSLSPLDTSLIQITPDQAFIGRTEYRLRAWRGALQIGTYYEIGTGLEQKRNFIYLEVNSGQGIYTWVDYNTDGVKDINEFEIAQYIDQANYIRIFTPSNEYQKVYTNEYNQSFEWRPEIIWNQKKGILHVLSLFSLQTRIRSLRKLNAFNSQDLFNPYKNAIESNSLSSSSYLLRNTCFFNRTSSVFTGEYIYNFSANKLLLANGFDAKEVSYNELAIHWNISTRVFLKLQGHDGNKLCIADYTTGRNFKINSQFINGEIAWQPSTNYRTGLGVRVGKKINDIGFGGEICSSKEIQLNFKYNTTQKGSLQADLKLINLNFIGNDNTPISFEMLDALKPGTNFTWTLQFQRNISTNMQLSLQYSGRTVVGYKTIHNGGMEIRAFF